MLKRHIREQRPAGRRQHSSDLERTHESAHPAEPRKKEGLLKQTKKKVSEDNMSLIAAGVAFYLLLGLVPALVAFISIYGLLANPQQIEQHFAAISGILPGAVSDIMEQQMKRISANTTGASIGAAVGIFVALWGASKSMKIITNALNIAYEEPERRGFVKLTFVTLGLTLAAVVMGILAIGTIILLPRIVEFLNLGSDAHLLANAVRWPLLGILAIFGLSMLYKVAPSRTRGTRRKVLMGALVAMLLWVLASAGFAFYVSNFGKYNETYGSLAAIVIMLMWLYFSAFVVLIGAELNSVREHRTAH